MTADDWFVVVFLGAWLVAGLYVFARTWRPGDETSVSLGLLSGGILFAPWIIGFWMSRAQRERRRSDDVPSQD